jgi:hypothetical protein
MEMEDRLPNRLITLECPLVLLASVEKRAAQKRRSRLMSISAKL